MKIIQMLNAITFVCFGSAFIPLRHCFVAAFCVITVTLTVNAQPLDPAQGTSEPGSETIWYDGQLLTLEGKGWPNTASPYDRLPASAQGVVPEPVWNLSLCSTGMSLRFGTDAENLKVRWTLRKSSLAMPHMPATGVSGVDLYVRDDTGVLRYIKTGRPTELTNTAEFTVSPSDEYVLYLPLYNGIESIQIGIPDNRRLKSVPAPQRRRNRTIVFYGTSITQGGCASRPGMASTTIAGRMLDATIINLGFSGSGKMEPEMAALLAELDPAMYVLDCLANMKPEMVSERIAPFVKTLRAAHPATPIVLVEDSSVRNVTPTEKGRLLRAIFKNLQSEQVPELYLVPNTGMLGTDGEGTVDGGHPNDLGMMRQAEVFVRALEPILKKKD